MRSFGVNFADNLRKDFYSRTETTTSGEERQSIAKDAKIVLIVVDDDIENAWSGA